MAEKKNPMVFMDVSICMVPVGRMVFELFRDDAPAMVENFRALCTGEKGIGKITKSRLHYKGSYFYDIWQKYTWVKGGAFGSPVGCWGESIYGKYFPDEWPERKCNERGLLCMYIGDRYTLGSHFVITLEPDQSLDRCHIVFGRLSRGFETLDRISNVVVGQQAQVSNCGEFNLHESREGRKREKGEREERIRRKRREREEERIRIERREERIRGERKREREERIRRERREQEERIRGERKRERRGERIRRGGKGEKEKREKRE